MGLLLSPLAIGAAGVRNWRLVIAIAPRLAFTVGPVLWSCRPRFPPCVPSESIKITTVNLLYDNHCPAALVDEISAARPDVLRLQDYSPAWGAALVAVLALHYPCTRLAVRDDAFGLAIYSRWPLVGEARVALPMGTSEIPQARAVVRIGQHEVALYKIHLLPPGNLT